MSKTSVWPTSLWPLAYFAFFYNLENIKVRHQMLRCSACPDHTGSRGREERVSIWNAMDIVHIFSCKLYPCIMACHCPVPSSVQGQTSKGCLVIGNKQVKYWIASICCRCVFLYFLGFRRDSKQMMLHCLMLWKADNASENSSVQTWRINFDGWMGSRLWNAGNWQKFPLYSESDEAYQWWSKA